MKNKSVSCFLLLATFACTQEKKFSGGPGKGQVEDAVPMIEAPAPAPQPTVILEEKSTCEPANIIKDAFPKEIGDCYESGRVWNFDSKACVTMKKATFACNWNNVIAELQMINLPNATVTKASQSPKTSILIGCGQSEDKSRIVVQWVNVPEGNGCKNLKPGGTVTGCFTNYGATEPPPPPASEEERKSRTYACMNQL